MNHAEAAFEAEVDEALEASHAAFMGRYKAELTQLAGLSKAEIDAITPDHKDLEVYDQLMTVVKEASRRNVSNAQLAARIKKLGEVAVTIAKKVGGLAALVV